MAQQLKGCWNQLQKPEVKLCPGTMYQVTKEGCVTEERKPRVTINQINGVMDAAGTPTNYDGCIDAQRKPYWTNLPNCPDPLPTCGCCTPIGGAGTPQWAPRYVSLSIGGLQYPIMIDCVPDCLSKAGINEGIGLVNDSFLCQGVGGYYYPGWGQPVCAWFAAVRGELCKDIYIRVMLEPKRTNGVGPTFWVVAEWKCYQWGDHHFFYGHTDTQCPGPCWSTELSPVSYTVSNLAGWGCAGGGGGGKFGGSATVTFPAYPY
jgi:hypothetical protein